MALVSSKLVILAPTRPSHGAVAELFTVLRYTWYPPSPVTSFQLSDTLLVYVPSLAVSPVGTGGGIARA